MNEKTTYQPRFDTGGTFIGCISIYQWGKEYCKKVLSNSSLRGKIVERISSTNYVVENRWELERNVIRGFSFRLLGQEYSGIKVARYNPKSQVLELNQSPENPSGKWNGGNGIVRRITFPEAVNLSVLTQQSNSGPYRLNGGENGLPGKQKIIRKNGDEIKIESKQDINLNAGDSFIKKTPGGGGFGEKQLRIRFNPWKHHLNFVRQQLEQAISCTKDENLKNILIENIRLVNSNYVDVYTGKFQPGEIIGHIERKLEKMNITNREQFALWLGRRDYRNITLPDGSGWVLREGNEPEYDMHLHPARTGPHLLRVQGNWWKTAVAIRLFYPEKNDPDPVLVNRVRKEVLNISPVKRDRYNRERLRKIMDHLK
jgi:hypothetical protein